MSTPSQPPQLSAAALRRAGWPNGELRVADADRAEVADRLAKHYSDGRLDQAEFDDRLDRAMRAKTQADLVALLSDLPDGQPRVPPVDPNAPRSLRHQQRQLLRLQLERERLMLRHERREHRRREREMHLRGLRQLPSLIVIVVVALAAAAVLRHIYSIWLVMAVLGFLWLWHAQRGNRK